MAASSFKYTLNLLTSEPSHKEKLKYGDLSQKQTNNVTTCIKQKSIHIF